LKIERETPLGGGNVGREENGDAGDVVRLPEATKRCACDHRFLEIATHDAATMRSLGLDAARRNGVNADFLRTQLRGERARNRIYSTLAPGIDGGLRRSRACN
jgi:hypothetical protein